MLNSWILFAFHSHYCIFWNGPSLSITEIILRISKKCIPRKRNLFFIIDSEFCKRSKKTRILLITLPTKGKSVNFILKAKSTFPITFPIIQTSFLYLAKYIHPSSRYYSFFVSIFAISNANGWTLVASWVPNPHIALLLIRKNVIFFSQCRTLKLLRFGLAFTACFLNYMFKDQF